MKVVSTAKLSEEIKKELAEQFPQTEFFYSRSLSEEKELLSEADILITYGEDVLEEHLEGLPKLKWMMVISAGLEKMPLKAIKEKGIIVTNARGIHRIPMAEYTFAVLLSVAKQTKTWFKQQDASVWNRRLEMVELFGETMTIIGPGAIGSEIARLAKAFGMTTIGVNRSGQPAEHLDTMYTIDQLNQACDASKYVVSILPQTDETMGLLGHTFFQSLRDDAVFVNIGRGKTVDEAALLDALEKKTIGHAVLDVFEVEPLPEEHPFWKMENVTITPHFSAVTANYQPRAIEIFKENLTKYLNNEKNLVNLIDLDRGY